jgi:transcription antitermination factor NusG
MPIKEFNMDKEVVFEPDFEVEASEDEELTVEFLPGAFDDFEGTQEELDQFIKEIVELFRSGKADEMSEEVSEERMQEILSMTDRKLQ